MECIRTEIPEMFEAINEDTLRFEFFDAFPDLLADRFALHFCGREDVVRLNFGKQLRRRCEIQHRDLTDLQPKRSRIRPDVLSRLPKRDEQSCFPSSKEMQAQRSFTSAGLAVNQVRTTGKQPAAQDVIKTINTRGDSHGTSFAFRDAHAGVSHPAHGRQNGCFTAIESSCTNVRSPGAGIASTSCSISGTRTRLVIP